LFICDLNERKVLKEAKLTAMPAPKRSAFVKISAKIDKEDD